MLKEEIWKEDMEGWKEEKKEEKKEGRPKKNNNKNFDRILTRQTNTTHSNVRVESQASKTRPEHVTAASEARPEYVTAWNRSERKTRPEHVTEDRRRAYRTCTVQLQHSHKPPDARQEPSPVQDVGVVVTAAGLPTVDHHTDQSIPGAG